MNRKPIYVVLTVLILSFALALSASAAGPTPAAWDASSNAKTVNVVANETLTGNGLIKADGAFLCAGEDNVVTEAKLASGTKLNVYSGNTITGESTTAAVIIKTDGAPFVVSEVISITVKNGNDTAGVGFTAYNCNGVTLPADAKKILDSYVTPAPAPKPAGAPAPAAGSSITLTAWAQFEPQKYESTKQLAISGTYTVTVAGDYAAFGVDDAATSVSFKGAEILPTCTADVKMQGELLRVVVCPGPFAVGDKVIVNAKDTKGYGVGSYAQSGINRFSGTYMLWNTTAKTLDLTDVMPEVAQAAADAAALAPKPAADPRLDAIEARQTDIEAKLQTLFEQLALIVARLK